MKRYFLKLGILALLMVWIHPLNAQDLEIKIVKADTILIPGKKCTIELSVSGGMAPYIYMLFDNEPWEGGNTLEKTSATNELTHAFIILNAGRYLVAVRDSNDLTKIVIIQIKIAGTALINRITGTSEKQYLM